MCCALPDPRLLDFRRNVVRTQVRWNSGSEDEVRSWDRPERVEGEQSSGQGEVLGRGDVELPNRTQVDSPKHNSGLQDRPDLYRMRKYTNNEGGIDLGTLWEVTGRLDAK